MPVSLSPCLSPMTQAPNCSFHSFMLSISFIFCSRIISPIIPLLPCKKSTSEMDQLSERARNLPEPAPREGGQSEGQLADLPIDWEWVWGWGPGLTPVRWWSGSQVKNIWPSDGRAVAHALARPPLRHGSPHQCSCAFSNEQHAHTQAALLVIRTKTLADSSKRPP